MLSTIKVLGASELKAGLQVPSDQKWILLHRLFFVCGVTFKWIQNEETFPFKQIQVNSGTLNDESDDLALLGQKLNNLLRSSFSFLWWCFCPPSATGWSWQRKKNKVLRWKQKQEQGAREKEKELEEKYFKVCGLIFFGNKFSQHGSRSGEAGRTTMCFDTSSASNIDSPQSSQLSVPSNFTSWTSMPWRQTLSSCNLVTPSSCHPRIRDIWGFLSDEILIGFVGLFI